MSKSLMGMCADEIAERDKKIADLQAKLAESEKENQDFLIKYKHWRTECEQLKQQLAKKDIDLSLARNEIDTLKHNLNIAQEHDNIMCEQYFKKCKETNQDKISFAVEQLEKVKTALPTLAGLVQWDDYYIHSKRMEQYIDQQIKQLKEIK